MRKIVFHKVIVIIYTLIVLTTFTLLLTKGFDYYRTSIEERYFHILNTNWKSSGLYSHGFGIIGSLLIVFGVGSYMVRKRFRRFSRLGILRNWLLFHIFMCVEGSVLILFHTTFKFGGIVAVSFWSMVAVLASGVIGRYIYLQIPRTIEGREMSRMELDDLKSEINKQLRTTVQLDESVYEILNDDAKLNVGFFSFLYRSSAEKRALRNLKNSLKEQQTLNVQANEIIQLFKKQISLKKRVGTLVTMQNLFKYWHVAHLPFALIMLVIMIIHIVVAVTFGYKWIF